MCIRSSLCDFQESAGHSLDSILKYRLMHMLALLADVSLSNCQKCDCYPCRHFQLCQSFWLPPRLRKWTLCAGIGYCSTMRNAVAYCSGWHCIVAHRPWHSKTWFVYLSGHPISAHVNAAQNIGQSCGLVIEQWHGCTQTVVCMQSSHCCWNLKHDKQGVQATGSRPGRATNRAQHSAPASFGTETEDSGSRSSVCADVMKFQNFRM